MMMVAHGVVVYLDHLPLWIDTDGGRIYNQGKKPFRFKAMWVGERECADIIEKSLRYIGSHNTISEVMARISKCSEELNTWNRSIFGNVQKQLQN